MLRKDTRFRDYHVNVCSNFGGLGDMIARLPAIKHMMESYPQVISTVYWHDYFVDVARLLLPETERLKHKTLSEMEWADTKIPLTDFSPRHVSSFSMHLTQHAHLMLVNRVIEDANLLMYLQAPHVSLPSRLEDLLGFKKYVVITAGYTAPARIWPSKEVEKVIAWCNENGYLPVVMGNSKKVEVGNGNEISAKFPPLKGEFLSLVDQTSLIEALGVIQRASAVVGVDNGLLHLASCTNTPVVWGFTSVLPEHRLPYVPANVKQAVVLPSEKLECTGCQSKAYFVRHEFKYCMFKDYKCVSEMHGEKFIEGLRRVL